MLAVCKAQFSAKRYQDGMQGLLALAQSNPCFARIFQREMDMDVTEMTRISRCDTCSATSGFRGLDWVFWDLFL